MNNDPAIELEDYFAKLYANKYSVSELNLFKEELIKKGNDTSVIDKALKIKEVNIKEGKDFEKKNKRVRLVGKQAFFSALLGGKHNKKNNDLASWEYQKMLNNELEEHNFEEETTDEDDFYSDDLD